MKVHGYKIEPWANLYGANLRGVDLCWANLREADLYGANLYGADLCEAENIPKLIHTQTQILPDCGSVVGWKKCEGGVMVKLLIEEGIPRSNATTRKCRAKEAKVLEVIGADAGVSQHDGITTYEHICETLGDVAYKVMELRQGGVPMSTVMQISDSELVQAIVVDAYDQPRFSTDSYKREATNDFRNDVEVQCYKSIDH